MRKPIVLVVALLVAPLAVAEDKPLPRIIAHRGLIQSLPENTLAAFEKCLENGFAIELDVRRSKDGYLVVLHDATLDRTTNGTGQVANLALDELKKLEAGTKAKPALTGQRVPDLRRVFALVRERKPADIAVAVDLKINDGKVEADVVKLAKEAGVLDRLLFIGTTIEDAEVRKRLRAADAGAHVCCLANAPQDLAAALEDRFSDWAYVRFIPTEEHMKALRQAKKKVFLVGPLVAGQEPDNWKKAHRAGVDAVLTDFPVELRAVLK